MISTLSRVKLMWPNEIFLYLCRYQYNKYFEYFYPMKEKTS